MGYRYIGAKTKIKLEIIRKIKSIIGDKGTVVDMMCGTGAISAELRKNGYSVIAVDLMSQSYHHTRVQLLLKNNPPFKHISKYLSKNISQNLLNTKSNYEAVIQTFNNIKPIKGYFWREFSPEGIPKNGSLPRKYFTSENAQKIDAVRELIKKMREENAVSDIEYSLLIHDLIMAANDVANIAGTYGHYLSKFMGRSLQPIKFIPTKFLKEGPIENHRVIQGYAEDVAGDITADLCYIDPPYIKRQYAANYHILETLARGDKPEAIGVSGLRPWRDQYSDFCSKIKIRPAFEKIFTNMKCPHFLISYSSDGLLEKQELIDFFSHFGKVSLTEFSNKRFKSRKEKSEKSIIEYIFHISKFS